MGVRPKNRRLNWPLKMARLRSRAAKPRVVLGRLIWTNDPRRYGYRLKLMADQTVHLWRIDDPTRPVPLGPPVKAHKAEVRGVGFADMTTLVSAAEDGLVRVWDISDPSHPSPIGPPLAGHRGIAVRSLAINPNARIAATGDVDAFVRLWSLDRNHLSPIGPPLKGHTRGMLRSLAFSSDGLRMVTGSDDRTARQWNVVDPAQATPIGPPLTGHQDEVTSVAVSPKEPVFVTGSDDQTVRQWNLDAAHPTARGRPLTGPRDEVYSVAFTPDGSLLAAGVADGTVVVWNVAGGTLPAPLGSPLVGHKAGVDPVAFSPNGDVLASASEDKTVKLWTLTPDRANPSLVASLGHEDEVASAAFSPDEAVLATGSEGTVHLWNVTNPRHRPLSRSDIVIGQPAHPWLHRQGARDARKKAFPRVPRTAQLQIRRPARPPMARRLVSSAADSYCRRSWPRPGRQASLGNQQRHASTINLSTSPIQPSCIQR